MPLIKSHSTGERRASQAPGYRTLLLERRASVLASMGVKSSGLAREGRLANDDEAQRSHDEFVTLHLSRLDYAQLLLVNEALDRLATGEYGTCQECEEAIPPKRLQAVPWARFCVACQEEAARRAALEAVGVCAGEDE
jgi:DnaK suppressor protein